MDYEPGTSAADQAYTWIIRALYAGLVAGNLFLLWDAYKDTPSGIELRARARARWRRLQGCEGCARRKEWIRDRAHMLWQANEIVEQAQSESESE